MKIYKTLEFEITNKTTGEKKIRKQRIESQTRCDYGGLVITKLTHSYCSYNLNYGDNDSLFGEGEGEDELRELGVNVYEFLSQPYEFYDDSYSIGEYFNQETNIRLLFSEDFPTIESILRYVRTRTALKLIKDGEINPEDLNKELVIK